MCVVVYPPRRLQIRQRGILPYGDIHPADAHDMECGYALVHSCAVCVALLLLLLLCLVLLRGARLAWKVSFTPGFNPLDTYTSVHIRRGNNFTQNLRRRGEHGLM